MRRGGFVKTVNNGGDAPIGSRTSELAAKRSIDAVSSRASMTICGTAGGALSSCCSMQ